MTTATGFAYEFALFCVSSVGMMMANKVAVTAFPFPFTLAFIQAFGTLVLLRLFRKSIPRVTLGTVGEWLPIACLFLVMICTSLISLRHASVSTVIIMRNFGSGVTTVVEYLVRNERVNSEVMASEVAILFGAYLYGWKNASFEWETLLWLLVNVCAQTSYSVLLKYKMTMNHQIAMMSKFTMSFLNNVMALPVLFVFLTSELRQVSVALQSIHGGGWMAIASTVVLGFMISTSGFGLQKLVSATTFVVLNNLTKFINILLGVLFLREQMGIIDSVGCFIAIVAGGWYSSALARYKTSSSIKQDARSSASSALRCTD